MRFCCSESCSQICFSCLTPAHVSWLNMKHVLKVVVFGCCCPQFGSLLVVVFVAELTAGIVGYVYIKQVREGIGRGMNASVSHYTGGRGMADETVDFVQDKASFLFPSCTTFNSQTSPFG